MSTQAVYVLMETGGDGPPQRIENDIEALPSGQFRRGHEVRIAGNEHDTLDEAFVCQ